MGEIRIHGRGGQGTVVAAEMLANAFVLGGKYASVFPSFGVERRGAAVMAFARFGQEPVREHTRVYRPDIVLILDQALTHSPACYEGLKRGGIIVANTTNEQSIVNLNLTQQLLATGDALKIALEETGTTITNTCMLGAFAKATQSVELADLKQSLSMYFKGTTLTKNLRSLERGFDEVKISHFQQSMQPAEEPAPRIISGTIQAPPIKSPFPAPWVDGEEKLVTVRTGNGVTGGLNSISPPAVSVGGAAFIVLSVVWQRAKIITITPIWITARAVECAPRNVRRGPSGCAQRRSCNDRCSDW